MGRVTGSWDRPIQGVSQQVDKDRRSGQCSLQENMMPSPLSGLIKRIGTRHLAKIMDSVSPLAKFYAYNRGVNEAYLIAVEPNTVLPRAQDVIRVFDLEGNERTVNYGTVNTGYYRTGNPSESLSMSTIGDFTFLTNKDVIVETLDDVTPDNPPIAIVYCQFATYSRDYIIKSGDTIVAQFTTPDSSTVDNEPFIKTNYVMQRLADQVIINTKVEVKSAVANVVGTGGSVVGYKVTTDLPVSQLFSVKYYGTEISVEGYYLESSNVIRVDSADEYDVLEIRYSPVGALPTGFTAEVDGNVMYLSRDDQESFSIDTVDSADGNDLIAIQDRVSSIANLPPKAPDGYTVKVQNQQGFDANAFWLTSVPATDEDQTGSEVRWEEAPAQGSKYKLDKETMPHVLISESDGSFTFQVGDWEDREVGNDDSNPFPSFVGSTISTLGSFQNRVLITSEEAAIFGRTNRFFNLFRESTQVESAADPIDVFADDDQINKLLHHAVLDGDIVFFSKNGQFLINGSQPITKDNVIFKKVTAYPMNTEAPPAVTGESVIYSFVAGKYSGLREMFTDSLTDTKRARPITDHVSEYIEGTPTQITSSPNINTLLVNTDVSTNEVYVHDWLWVGDEKAQSAFHKWVFGGNVLFTEFIEDKLYMVIHRNEGVFLEQIPLGNDTDDSGIDFGARLDQRQTVTANWTGSRWEWVLPYEVQDQESLVFVLGSGGFDGDRGVSVAFFKDGETYWTDEELADESVGTCTLTAGTKFSARYKPTKPFLKDQNGRVMGLDRFTLGKVHLNYESIGETKITVSDEKTSRSWVYNNSGRFMGRANNTVGFADVTDGTFTFPVRLESDRADILIETDSYRPFILRDMEYSGMFKQRGKRF